jgi:AcrR family transcriptional regulator
MRTRDSDKEALVKQKAVELLVTSGFEGFSTNKLAKLCGMSVATLYIYYKDKEDLIVQIGREQVRQMRQATGKGFRPDFSLEEGLRVQWQNRYDYLMNDALIGSFLDQLRTSSYQHQIYAGFRDDEGDKLGEFIRLAIGRGELRLMPVEVFWSVAFSPLNTLIRAHHEGQRASGKPFLFTHALLWQTFELVLNGLKN